MQWYPLHREEFESVAEEVTAELVAKGMTAHTNADRLRIRGGTGPGNVPRGYRITPHARLRMRQRNLSKQDIEYIMRRGAAEYVANALIYSLRRIDVPAEEQQQGQRLVGATVIMAVANQHIITVWRNRKHSTRTLRRKRARRWHSCVTSPL